MMNCRLSFLVILLFSSPVSFAQLKTDSLVKIDTASKPKTQKPAARAPVPNVLPGKGLAQHDFIYTGEWDTRKDSQTVSLVRGGKVVWTYSIPNKDHNNVLSEFSDLHLLSNGNVLYACKTGAAEVNKDKKIVWSYECPPGAECHSAQPVGLDKVFLCQNGTPAKAMLINKKTGKMEMEHELQTKNPTDPKSVHGQFRNIRMMKQGTYLIPHLNLGKVIEYDKDWNVIFSVEAPSAWYAERLKNGNTLISGNQNGYVREVNPKGEIVWEINKDDLPGFPLYTVHQVARLANGNTVICNWGGFLRKEDWDKVVQVIEVTPDKKVTWALHQWKDPDLGPSSCIQILGDR
jgi:Mal s 1 allergenic protein-like